MASEFTQYYNLDKYTNADKPNLRDQYNGAMDKIDAQLHAEADNITVAIESANLARDKANEVADNLAKTTEELTKELGDTNTEVNAVRTTAEEGLAKATANSARIQELKAETANMDAQLEDKITQETDARIAADSAIKDIATKAVEEVGKAAEEIGTYTEAINTLNIAAINFVDNAEPLYRFSIEYNDVRYNTQGSTFFKNESGNVISCYYSVNDDSAPGHLVSYKNDDKISDLTLSLGHGNSMAYHDGYVYVPDNSVTHAIYKISISSEGRLGTSTVACYPAVSGSICHHDRLGKWYIANNTSINEINIETGQVINSIAVDFDKYSQGGTGQSLTIFSIGTNDYIGHIYSQPNCFVIFDLDGNFITTKALPNYVGWVPMGEPESMRIDSEGNYNLVGAEPGLPDSMTKTAMMIYGNIFAKGSSCNHIERFKAAGGTMYIYCYPGSFKYSMPEVDTGGDPSSTNKIKISYMQDAQYIMDRSYRKCAQINIEEDGRRKNGLIIANTVAYIHMQEHILSTLELRSGVYQVQQSSQQINSTAIDSTYNKYRFRVIECPWVSSRYNVENETTKANKTGFYFSQSTVSIPTASNPYVTTSGNCTIINPDK